MESFRDENQLAAELRALRPAPRPAFAAELDARAAAGFPRRAVPRGRRLTRPAVQMRALRRRWIVVTAGAVGLPAIAIATVLVTGAHSGKQRSAEVAKAPPRAGRYFDGSGPYMRHAELIPFDRALANGDRPHISPRSSDAGGTASLNAGNESLNFNSSFTLPYRDVERSASIVLSAAPGDVPGDASRVAEAVHANRGIVLSSSTSNGSAGHAGASFQLLIPSARLGDAMAALAQIDEVRLRHEGTLDITGPTVSTTEALQDSQARIESLLAELAGAETETEREVAEAQLHSERRRHAALRAQLTHLRHRAGFSHVSVRIESTDAATSSGGSWGIGDALHEAGRVLIIVAGVLVIALAVLGPLALIFLLAWLGRRAWVRRARARALG